MPHCSKCETKFLTAIQLLSHWEHHCNSCQTKIYYPKLNEKYFHYNLAHKGVCPICDKIGFPDKSELNIHIRGVHHQFPCSFCWKVFSSELQLIMHLMNPGKHHAFACKSCLLSFHNNADMWYHFYQSHQPKCPLCSQFIWNIGKKMSFKSHWIVHMVKAHKMFPCEECPLVFSSSVLLEQHYGGSHRIVCDICLKQFRSSEDKDRHFRAAHQVQCSACDMYFGTHLEFGYHFRDTHRLKCGVCNNTFPTAEMLKEHLEKHPDGIVTDEMMECSICPEKFDDEEGLVQHYREEHTD